MSVRILISGWRAARPDLHTGIISGALDDWCAQHVPVGDIPTVVHGACHLGGVDQIAAEIAHGWGWTVEAHPAQGHPTQDFGPWPAAGPRRNAYMCSLGADVLLAFPGPASTGTWDAIRCATRRGIHVRIYPLTIQKGHR